MGAVTTSLVATTPTSTLPPPVRVLRYNTPRRLRRKSCLDPPSSPGIAASLASAGALVFSIRAAPTLVRIPLLLYRLHLLILIRGLLLWSWEHLSSRGLVGRCGAGL